MSIALRRAPYHAHFSDQLTVRDWAVATEVLYEEAAYATQLGFPERAGRCLFEAQHMGTPSPEVDPAVLANALVAWVTRTVGDQPQRLLRSPELLERLGHLARVMQAIAR